MTKTLDPFYTTHFTRLNKLENRSKWSYFKCNYCGDQSNSRGQRIEHCKNHLANHITSVENCPDAPSAAHSAAHLLMKAKKPDQAASQGSDNSNGSTTTGPPLNKKHKAYVQDNLDSVVDCPMSDAQQNSANRKLFKLVVHANLPFSVADNIFLVDFTNELRPSFKPASHFVMTQTFLDSEHSCVHLELVEKLAAKWTHSYTSHGWEDILRWSIYGVAAAQVGKRSSILGLQDLTGSRGDDKKVLDTANSCMADMGVVNAACILAAFTDNPSVMKKSRKDFEKLYPWVILQYYFRRVLALFTKPILELGRFAPTNQQRNVKKSLMVSKRIANPDVQDHDDFFWPMLNQIIHVSKPFVDSIAACKSQSTNLADCMLYFLGATWKVALLSAEEGNDPKFFQHPRENGIGLNLSARASVRILTATTIAGMGLKEEIETRLHAILSIVPHATEIECLFSGLNGIQSPKRNNLTIPNFPKLAVLCSDYIQEADHRTKKKSAPADGSEEEGQISGVDAVYRDLEKRLEQEEQEFDGTVSLMEGKLYDFEMIKAALENAVPIEEIRELNIVRSSSGEDWSIEDMIQ
ncbi:hypothetical protein BT96DRAFT_935033 [Gymnopus androsaceus JB14]|uniref:Uncharacterized protein n=1 Tax=Gymnopus androsaceus JB14 TaxID=1447944 RepID=A0A6A4I7D4_9AGAR|nr:hypothetical protein BT96DRAFT_935033 [Gymnopus androsaceus JB14]